MSVRRYRNYATVVYPDSAPEDWFDSLSDLHVPVFVSPLHDLDLNPTGEPKKAHYHVLVMFDNVKTLDQFDEVVDLIGGVGHEVVNSVRGYARYLCHLDNPEKTQYPPEDVKCLGGSDYFSICSLATDKYKGIREMIDFCEDNKLYCYADLLRYASEARPDWFRLLCDSCTVVMFNYLKSCGWRDGVSSPPID